MDVSASLREKTAPLGLYDTTPGTLVSAELEAFAAGLQPVCDELDELLRERFPDTAVGRGLEYFERILGVRGLDGSESGRRRSITAALTLTDHSNKLQDYDQLKDIFGVSGSFEIRQGEIVFNCTDHLTLHQYALLQHQMEKFAPVGVMFNIYQYG